MSSLEQLVTQQSEVTCDVVLYELAITRCFASVPVVAFDRFAEKSQARSFQPGALRKLRPESHIEATSSGA